MAPMEYLGAWGTLILEKNLKPKISCQTPFKKDGYNGYNINIKSALKPSYGAGFQTRLKSSLDRLGPEDSNCH